MRNVEDLSLETDFFLLQISIVQSTAILLLILWKHKLGDIGFSVDIKTVVSNVILSFELLATTEVK